MSNPSQAAEHDPHAKRSDPQASRRWLLLAYGLAVYTLSLATLACLAWMILRLRTPELSAPGPLPWSPRALGTNVALVALFGLQHSLMARSWFKRHLTRVVSQDAERSTYCLATCLALAAVVSQWVPMPGLLWRFESPALIWSLHLAGAAGALITLIGASSMGHLELLGVRRIQRAFHGRPEPAAQFCEPGLYRWMRHPIYTGTLLFLWATPLMTQGHLLFSGLLSAYIFVGVPLEERDLARSLGPAYSDYQQRVRRFLPR